MLKNCELLKGIGVSKKSIVFFMMNNSIEYIHTKLEEQKELAGMSYEEMLENFRGKEAE